MAREASSPEPLFLAIDSNLTWTAADVKVAISEKSYLTGAVEWLEVDAATGGVTLPMGPDSPAGLLTPGTKWVHGWIDAVDGETKFLIGPIVIVGTATEPDELILDGGGA